MLDAQKRKSAGTVPALALTRDHANLRRRRMLRILKPSLRLVARVILPGHGEGPASSFGSSPCARHESGPAADTNFHERFAGIRAFSWPRVSAKKRAGAACFQPPPLRRRKCAFSPPPNHWALVDREDRAGTQREGINLCTFSAICNINLSERTKSICRRYSAWCRYNKCSCIYSHRSK